MQGKHGLIGEGAHKLNQVFGEGVLALAEHDGVVGTGSGVQGIGDTGGVACGLGGGGEGGRDVAALGCR